jgi:hypothetical protein
MSDPQIEKLLIVQDRDSALQKIEQELDRIPQERKAIESLIATEQANIEAVRHALKQKEVERHELATEVQAKESAINRFLNQQLQVKKNDEYRALTHQIAQSEQDVSDLEEREIGLMLEIDSTREAFEAEKAIIDARIVEQKKQIALLGEREGNLTASIDEAAAAVAQARAAADENFLGHYDRVKKLCKRLPYVARIEAHKCDGCHLRVSNEVSSAALTAGEPSFCDQCARMVYA